MGVSVHTWISECGECGVRLSVCGGESEERK